jgi:hypothetical protein
LAVCARKSILPTQGNRGDVLVRNSDDKAIFRRVVLSLILDDKLRAAVVVSLSLTATAPLGLESLVVGLVLQSFEGSHSKSLADQMLDLVFNSPTLVLCQLASLTYVLLPRINL